MAGAQAILTDVSKRFVDQQWTSEECTKSMKMMETLAADGADQNPGNLEQMRAVWRALRDKRTALLAAEAKQTVPCHFCVENESPKGYVYRFHTYAENYSVLPEREYDFFDQPGTVVRCPICRGYGKITPEACGVRCQ
jgi:hypothetical protein